MKASSFFILGIILFWDIRGRSAEVLTCRSHHYLDPPDKANKTIECTKACYAFWIQDSTNPDHITILHQGCWSNGMRNQANCTPGKCITPPRGHEGEHRLCCCLSDRCNELDIPGVKVTFRTFLTSKVSRVESNNDSVIHHTPHLKTGSQTSPEDDEDDDDDDVYDDDDDEDYDNSDFQMFMRNRNRKEKQKVTLCAYQHINIGNRPRAVDIAKNIDTSLSTPSAEISTTKNQGTQIIRCTGENDSCYTFWTDTGENSTDVRIIQQGCFKSKKEDGACNPQTCTSMSPPKRLSYQLYGGMYGKFCCCYGNLCNMNVSDGYDPNQALTTEDEAYYHLQDGSYVMYKERTIIISLVSVCSVALITVGVYLLYRLCLTSRKPSPDSLHLVEAPPSSGFDVDDLKINYQISQTKNGEVWHGTMGDLPVAVKIFNANHKQLYQNEKYIYTLPHIEHSNLLKFYGTDERLTPDAGWKFFIILSYASKGNLQEYLRNNTLEWSIFCRMCLGTIRGLIHLHTDIRKGDKFKPTVAHRDLNTRNILVRDDLSCVIGDLGFAITTMGSKLIKNGQYEHAEQAALQDVGTLRYMAPELLDGAANLRESEASLKQIDVYALGLVLWEIATRCTDLYHGVPLSEYQLPYQREAGIHPSFEEMQILVSRNKVRPKFPEVWRDYCQAVRALKETIEDCWDHDAEARLTAMCVEERILDMMTLWAQDTKNKGATPTVTTTSNLFEQSSDLEAANSQGDLDPNMTVPMATANDQPVLSVMDCSTASHVITSPPNGYINSENVVSQSSPIRGRGGITASASTTETFLLSPSEDEHPHKMLNVTLAKNNMVGPRQGRNPTVERNTHKRSDEEIAVSGNKLVYSSGRRGSDSVQSAPPMGEEIFDSLNDNADVALVQSDALNHSRAPRIPLVQNQVHNDHRIIRPKVANLPTTNPLLRDADGNHGDRRGNKSRLGKLIKVKDIGNKLSQIAMLAKRASKSRNKNNCNKNEGRGSENVDLIHGSNIQNPQQVLPISNDIVEHQNKVVNRNTPIQTEVKIRNGSAVVTPAMLMQNRQNSIGSSEGDTASYDSDQGHDNRIFMAEVGVAKLQKIPSKGRHSVIRVRKGSHSRSTPDLSPKKTLSLKEFSLEGKEESVKLKRPSSLSLRGHNYRQKVPTKSNTCESLDVLVRNSKNEAKKSTHLDTNEDVDPTSKIKRCVKTPVKVKHGRFSLYDDRLMTQLMCNSPELIDEKLLPENGRDSTTRRRSVSSSDFLLDGCDTNMEVLQVHNVVHVI